MHHGPAACCGAVVHVGVLGYVEDVLAAIPYAAEMTVAPPPRLAFGRAWQEAKVQAEATGAAPWPARWWRHVVMRAATEVPGVEIDYENGAS